MGRFSLLSMKPHKFFFFFFFFLFSCTLKDDGFSKYPAFSLFFFFLVFTSRVPRNVRNLMNALDTTAVHY